MNPRRPVQETADYPLHRLAAAKKQRVRLTDCSSCRRILTCTEILANLKKECEWKRDGLG
jgi:hypothetical protein